MNENYQVVVYFRPLATQTTYSTEIDVTDRVLENSISEVSQFIDSADYDIGLVSFGEVEIELDNFLGEFNDVEDSRSIFPIKRDQTKVRIVLRQATVTRETDGTVSNYSQTDTTIFNGLIIDDGTRDDIENDSVRVRCLSQDSIMLKAKVSPTLLSNNLLASEAMFRVFNQDIITKVLTVHAANINPEVDYVIDDSSVFDNLTVFDAINKMLPASNSVVLIDTNGNLSVQSRDANTGLSTIELFGQFDLFGRENILGIQNVNNGVHRSFNSARANNFEVSDSAFVEEFGLKQKSFDLDFITNDSTKTSILSSIVNEFKVPKQEFEVIVSLDNGKDYALLQRVKLYYPLKLTKEDGEFFPVFGDAVYNDTDTPYPSEFGGIEIPPERAFKIIELRHNLPEFTTTVKCRQVGKTYNDGYF